MTQFKKVRDPEKVKRTVEQLRESNRQLEIFTLKLDELLAMVETDIRCQRLERLQGKYKRPAISESANE